jgi:gliding motility-associated-like protein
VDPEDVQIIADVKANPGGDGYNHITWDGNDNYGKPVSNGISLAFTITNLSGLTHLPIFDIENNDYGYIVSQIRPAGGQLKIYWDDSDIGGSPYSSTGCLNASGCHTWNNDFGNNKTINSWWFVSWSETIPVTFITTRQPEKPSLSGNSVHCIGTAGSLDFYVANDPNSTVYSWSYSGKGVTIDGSGRNATLDFASNATEGKLSVKGQNAECGDGPVTEQDITFEPLPVVTLAPFQEICYTAPGFRLTGGEPQGGSYFVDGNQADSLFPYKEPEGLHQIVYAYTSPTTCSNSDTTEILLYSGPECLGTVFFPNAFKPGNDSLNKVFRPVVRNISSFQMYIFDRWGQLIFTTDDAAKGWDGKLGGKDCPEGMYTFSATFGLSLREGNIESRRGFFSLIR